MASDGRSASYQRMLAITFQEWSAHAYLHARDAMQNDKYAPRARQTQTNAADYAAQARFHFDQATDGRT